MGRYRLIFGASLGLAGIVIAYFVWQAVSTNSLRQEALDRAKKGDFVSAEPSLKSALQRVPFDVDLLRALATGYLQAGRKDLADEYLTRWLDAAPGETEALQLRVKLYQELGQFEKALSDVDRLVQIDSANIAYRRKRVAVLYSASRFAEAEKECQFSLQNHPGDRELRFMLAEIKQAHGALSEVGAILDSLLSETPKSTAVLMARAQLHLKQNQPDRAIPLYRKVLELEPRRQFEPRRRAALYYLAIALDRVGEKVEASRLMAEFHRMQDADVLLEDSAGQRTNVPLQMRAARAQFDANNWNKTLEIVQHVLSVDADYVPAHLLMADTLDKLGRHDQAAQHRQRAKDKR